MVTHPQRPQFGPPNQYGQNLMTERGHIYWGHTLFSKIYIIFIVIKPSQLLKYRNFVQKVQHE